MNHSTAHILGPDGRPARPIALTDPGYSGGWRLLEGAGPTPAGLMSGTNINQIVRADEQRKARLAYFLNPVLYAAISTITGYVIGDQFSYGDLEDRRAQDTLDEFWATNDFGALAERMFIEHMLDGETATVWGDDPGPNQPAMIGLADVLRGVEVDDDMGRVTKLKVATGNTEPNEYEPGEFLWHATDALYNDPRGFPPIMRAVPACLAYVALLNHRVRAWELQGRINAIYTALTDGTDFHQNLAQLQAKAAAYSSIPRNGAVLTIGKDARTGQSETVEFITPGGGATNAHDDARMLRLTAAAALGLPEHYLGEGGNVTRTTADSMGDPARKAFSRRQALVRRWADDAFQNELRRRHGPNQTYMKRIVRVSEDGLTRTVRRVRIPASMVEVPWVFPSLSSSDIEGVVRKVEIAAANEYASWQTLSAELGFDPALERERIDSQQTQPTTEPSQVEDEP